MVQQLSGQVTLLSDISPDIASDIGVISRATEQLESDLAAAQSAQDALNQQLTTLDRGSAEYRRIEREAAQYGDAITEIERRQESLNEVSRRLDRITSGFRAARNVSLAFAAVSFGAVAGSLAAVHMRLEDIREVQRDLPTASDEFAQRLSAAARITGRDVGQLSALFFDAGVQLGEFQSGMREIDESLRDVAASSGIELNDLLRAGSPDEFVRQGIAALRQIEDEAARSAIAEELFGGEAGRIALSFTGVGELEELNESLRETTVVSEEAIRRGEEYRQSQERLKNSVSVLATEFSAGLTPSIAGAQDRATSFIEDTLIPMAENNRALALSFGGVALGASGAAAVFDRASESGNLLASALLFRQAGGLAGVAGGFSSVASGIRAMTGASLAFLATPIGLAIAGIGIAVLALAGGLTFLADRVGGFGNAWDLVWSGAVGVAKVAVGGILLQFEPLIRLFNILIEQSNRFLGTDYSTIGLPSDLIRSGLDDLRGVGQDYRRLSEAESVRREQARLEQMQLQAVESLTQTDAQGFQRVESAIREQSGEISAGLEEAIARYLQGRVVDREGSSPTVETQRGVVGATPREPLAPNQQRIGDDRILETDFRTGQSTIRQERLGPHPVFGQQVVNNTEVNLTVNTSASDIDPRKLVREAREEARRNPSFAGRS